jgi:hypothetical protein
LKVRDKISDNYRKQIDAILDNQSDHNSYNSLSQEESDEIWEEISVEMDIDEVWNSISSDLDNIIPSDSVSGIFVKSIAAFLIILIGMIPVKKLIPDPVITQPDILVETKQNGQSTELIPINKPGDSNTGEQLRVDIRPSVVSSSTGSEESNRITPEENNWPDLNQETLIPLSNENIPLSLSSSNTADSNLVVSSDRIKVEISGIPVVLFPDDQEKTELFPKTNPDRLIINDNLSAAGFSSPSTERGKISGGLITMFKNTWLLNHETFDGLKPESLTTTEIVFHPDVGLSVNYSLNKNWVLQADGFFFSNTGQEYFGYYYGHYTRKEITLRYSTFALSAKYKFTGRGSIMHRYSVNLLAGSYLSFLHYADQQINTELENIGSQYRKFDFGIRLGGEFELHIFDQLSLAPGLFMSIGLPNIYKGTDNIPGYFRTTHNGNAGFQLAIYYHFN